jgi:hypothetical protein
MFSLGGVRRVQKRKGTVTMTINESIMYFFGIAAAVFIAIMVFDKLRGWFWDRYPKRRD